MEVLVIEQIDGKNSVVGVQLSEKPLPRTGLKTFNASVRTIRIVKFYLSYGYTIYVKPTEGEVTPDKLELVENKDPLIAAKNMAIMDINNVINQNVFQMGIIDAMDFLTSYMKLLNYGIYITDENREDKYFEIIEESQNVEEPEPLKTDSTFEEEQEYVEKKRAYDLAQNKLSTLETYLNAYDKLSKIKFIDDLMNKYKDVVNKSETPEAVTTAVKEYCDKLDNFMFTAPCTT